MWTPSSPSQARKATGNRFGISIRNSDGLDCTFGQCEPLEFPYDRSLQVSDPPDELIVDSRVRCQHGAPIPARRTVPSGHPASRLLDDHFHRGPVPGAEAGLEHDVGGSAGHQAVTPEVAEPHGTP